MPDAARAWLETVGRLYAGGSALALVMLVSAFPDFPLEAPGVLGRLALLGVPVVATLGALWRAPARWLVFAGPLVVLPLGYALTLLAVGAAADAAGVARPADDVVSANLVPLMLLMLPGALVGTVLAAASLER